MLVLCLRVCGLGRHWHWCGGRGRGGSFLRAIYLTANSRAAGEGKDLHAIDFDLKYIFFIIIVIIIIIIIKQKLHIQTHTYTHAYLLHKSL